MSLPLSPPRLLILWCGIFFTMSSPAAAQAPTPLQKSIQVFVKDENGSLVSGARLLIYSRDQHTFSEFPNMPAKSAVTLPPGQYRLYAAMTQPLDGYSDHYSSPEAQLTLREGDDPPSIILTLRKHEEPEVQLTERVFIKCVLGE